VLVLLTTTTAASCVRGTHCTPVIHFMATVSQ
jgi:hypothetical protein